MELKVEMLSRLKLMSVNEDGDWDLSDNDISALKWAVSELESRQTEQQEECVCETCRRQISMVDCAYGVQPVNNKCEKYCNGTGEIVGRGSKAIKDAAINGTRKGGESQNGYCKVCKEEFNMFFGCRCNGYTIGRPIGYGKGGKE